MYGNPDAGPTGETMDEGMPPSSPSATPNETPAPDDGAGAKGGEASLFITPDMLPPGMKVNEGDVLEFKVVNPSDADGHIEVVYNTGEGGAPTSGSAGDSGPSWEEDFRHEMSARNGDNEGAQ